MTKATDRAVAGLTAASDNVGGCGLVIGIIIGVFVALVPAWLVANFATGWARDYSYFLEEGQKAASPIVLSIVFGAVFVGSSIIIAAGAIILAFENVETRLKAQAYALLRIAEKTGVETEEVN